MGKKKKLYDENVWKLCKYVYIQDQGSLTAMLFRHE